MSVAEYLSTIEEIREDGVRLAQPREPGLHPVERLAVTAGKVYGPEHPNTARILLNLGLTRMDLGKDAAAQQNLERALAIQERNFGPASPRLVPTLDDLASLHLRNGRYAEAEPLYRRLLAMRDQGVEYKGWDKVLANYERLTAGSR